MIQHSNEPFTPMSIPQKLASTITALLEALDYARDVGSDRWDFAVAIRRLEELGSTESDLRWLVRKGYIEHAREVTPLGDDGRQFRPTGDLSFSKRSCIVLTEAGERYARSIIGNGLAQVNRKAKGNGQAVGANGNGHANSNCVPQWDAEARILYIDNRIVKRFRWRAANQEAILSVFQEEGWPTRVDDPLPPQPEQDSKRRLNDTIKCLNNKQANELIRFHGDGTGEGVTWERIQYNGTQKM